MAAAMTQQAPVPAAEPAGAEVFLGIVKSYNARRGFGFVACEQTALKFGRDVYIAKVEAQLVTSEAGIEGRSTLGEPLAGASLAEEDIIRFRVRLSVEGFPQAEQIQRLRKFQGVVVQPPAAEEPEGAAAVGRIVSDELQAAFGQREAILRRGNCGQAWIVAGDRVAFAVPDGCPGTEQPEALLVSLVPRNVPLPGGILGCFTIAMPRQAVPGALVWSRRGQAPQVPLVPRQDMHPSCHALPDRIVISGLPADADEEELLRFFTKHGAVGAPVACGPGGSFASVLFGSPADVPRFLGRSIHAFADDKDSRLVRLRPGCAGPPGRCAVGLPGLPQPLLAPGEQPGVLLVTWQPVVLATGYTVEMRPAGVEAPWSKVDASKGQLAGGQAASFGLDSHGCRVSGLAAGGVFEARISYMAACGCHSQPSGPSDWCTAAPQPSGTMGRLQLSTTPAAAPAYGWQGVQQQPPQPQAEAWASAAPQQLMPAGWRCLHGSVLAPPPTPEVALVDEGFAVLVQWTCVAHAIGYVVELREAASAHAERFLRQVPPEAAGSIAELRVGGLRPSQGASRQYLAQVRAVSSCGCESEPSQAGASQIIGGPVEVPAPVLDADVARYALPKALDSPSLSGGKLPSLLASRPLATPTAEEVGSKALPPNVPGAEEDDCIILD